MSSRGLWAAGWSKTSAALVVTYLTVGQYTDIIFPSYDVRFIAINDGVDSNRGDSEGFDAIRNLFNLVVTP